MSYGTTKKLPDGAKSSDGGGERSEGKTNGVAMGKADANGRAKGSKETGEYNTGKTGGVCYTHKKAGY